MRWSNANEIVPPEAGTANSLATKRTSMRGVVAMSEALANEPQSRAKTAQVTERIRMIKAAPRNDWISGYIAE